MRAKTRGRAFRAILTVILLAAACSSAAAATDRIDWCGGSYYFLGVNYPWYNYGWDFGDGAWGRATDWDQVDAEFADMAAHGCHVTRWFIFCDGRYAPEFGADGSVIGLDPYVLPDIDRLLFAAQKNQIYLIMCLLDFHWLNWPSTVNGVTMGGHSDVMREPAKRQSFMDNALLPVLEHVAGHPMIIGWDIMNEPEGAMIGAGDWGGDSVTAAEMQAFIQQAVDYVHAYSGGHYATVGCACRTWINYWKNMGLDYYQVHYYDWCSRTAYGNLGLDKPCIVGEFATTNSAYNVQWWLDWVWNNGYAGALGWSYRAGDDYSDWAGAADAIQAWEAPRHADCDIACVPETVSFSVAANTWSMVAFPGDAVDPDPQVVIGPQAAGTLWRYQPGSGYQVYDPGFADWDIERGRGYWLWGGDGYTITYQAWRPTSSYSFSLATPGWHLMGQPDDADTALTACTTRQTSPMPPTTRSFVDAVNVSPVWISDPLYGWDVGGYYYPVGIRPWDQDDTLRGHCGYWIYTFEADLDFMTP